MNGTFYKNPTFPGNDDDAIMNNYTDNIEEAVILDDKTNLEPGIDYLPMEQSYIENILGFSVKLTLLFLSLRM